VRQAPQLGEEAVEKARQAGTDMHMEQPIKCASGEDCAEPGRYRASVAFGIPTYTRFHACRIRVEQSCRGDEEIVCEPD
jgi:hypothetical protein